MSPTRKTFEKIEFDLDRHLWPWSWKFWLIYILGTCPNISGAISKKNKKTSFFPFFALIWPLWPWNRTDKVKSQKGHQNHALCKISCNFEVHINIFEFPPKIPHFYPHTDFAPFRLTSWKPSIFYLPRVKLRFSESFIKIGPVDVSN